MFKEINEMSQVTNRYLYDKFSSTDIITNYSYIPQSEDREAIEAYKKYNGSYPDRDSWLMRGDPIIVDSLGYSVDKSTLRERYKRLNHKKSMLSYPYLSQNIIEAYRIASEKTSYTEWSKEMQVPEEKKEEIYNALYNDNFIRTSNGGMETVDIPIHVQISGAVIDLFDWKEALDRAKSLTPILDYCVVILDKEQASGIQHEKFKQNNIGLGLATRKEVSTEVGPSLLKDQENNPFYNHRLDINERSIMRT